MKIYYPKDKNGNQLGFRTPEAFVYDTNGRSLTDKINSLTSNLSTRADITTVNSLASQLSAKANQTDLNALSARVDSLVSHNTDTTTNTELIDIRSRYDGVTSSSAGAAVRSADKLLDDAIVELTKATMVANASAGEYFRVMKMVRNLLDDLAVQMSTQGVVTTDIIRQVRNVRMHIDENIISINKMSAGMIGDRILSDDNRRRVVSLSNQVKALESKVDNL